MLVDSDFQRIAEIIRNEVPELERVILFGSYARNTANSGSDIDIAIIIKNEIDWKRRKDILNRVYQRTGDFGYNVDLLLKTSKDYKNNIVLPTISKIINREGKLLWQVI